MKRKYFLSSNIIDLGLFLMSFAFALDFSAPWSSPDVWEGCTATTVRSFSYFSISFSFSVSISPLMLLHLPVNLQNPFLTLLYILIRLSYHLLTLHIQCWRWPIGSFIVTCASLNLLTYFRQLPVLGIFIIMFDDVIKTMLKFLTVMIVFIVAFGLGFHLLFINNVGISLKKTFCLKSTHALLSGLFRRVF